MLISYLGAESRLRFLLLPPQGIFRGRSTDRDVPGRCLCPPCGRYHGGSVGNKGVTQYGEPLQSSGIQCEGHLCGDDRKGA